MSNNPLFRVLRSGTEYNALIPKSKCEKVAFGQGDTQFSIDNIIKQVLQHNSQLKEVARLLKRNDLAETCFYNHDFAFNHFQYMADGEAQMLRSPACSWKQRNEGIDCKSYSIIVSSLLVQQGIRHYVRKIKQPTFNRDLFTHVYVIVPVNQVSGTLKDGYYTIDGTLPTMVEPLFIEEKSFYMDRLQQRGLNGLDGVSFGDVKDYFNTPIDCMGGSAFSEQQAIDASNAIVNVFNALITQINQAVKTNDLVNLTRLDHTLKGLMLAGFGGYNRKKQEGWNDCTQERIDKQISLLLYLLDTVIVIYDAWLKQYFDVQKVANIQYSSDRLEFDYGFYFSYTNPPAFETVDERKFLPKPTATQIMAFEFTPYMAQVASGSTPLNLQSALSSLQTILVTAQTIGGNTGTPNPTTGTTTDTIYNEQNPQVQKAGFGTVGMILLALAGAGLAFSKTKPEPIKKTSATKNATKVATKVAAKNTTNNKGKK